MPLPPSLPPSLPPPVFHVLSLPALPPSLPPSFQDNRVTVVLRFIDRSSYSRLCKDVRRRQRRLQRKREGGREGGRK
jgi:hypothetical protein